MKRDRREWPRNEIARSGASRWLQDLTCRTVTPLLVLASRLLLHGAVDVDLLRLSLGLFSPGEVRCASTELDRLGACLPLVLATFVGSDVSEDALSAHCWAPLEREWDAA